MTAKIQNKKITVVGAELSGISVSLFLKSKGNSVFLSEVKSKDKIKQDLQLLDKEGIPYETGGHSDKVFDADLFVVSPGVPDTAPIITQAVERKIPVLSEIEVGFQFYNKPTIAITGTNGKTTTTVLIGYLLGLGKIKQFVAGNCAGDLDESTCQALTATANKWEQSNYAILEVSSFQLDHIETFKPKIAVLMNISPDHLDRYKTYKHYIQSKISITKNQTETDTFIYNADCDVIIPYLNVVKAEKIPFSIYKPLSYGAWLNDDWLVVRLNGKTENIVKVNDLFIKGKHNYYNALAAIITAKKVGVSNEIIAEGLRSFKGVEHRLEFVRQINGVSFYNDSKATNLDAVSWALSAFEKPVILIAGGRDAGKNDYTELSELVRQKVKEIIVIGEAAQRIFSDLSSIVKVTKVETLQDAVLLALNVANKDDIILLSPACKSFDMFESYKDRGNQFKAIVNGI